MIVGVFQIIRSLMYLMNCTRPDIAYAVSRLSGYTSNPNDDHWTALPRVVGYVSKTKEYALKYRKYPPVLEGYNDANWIANSDELKSTSGYVLLLEVQRYLENLSNKHVLPVPQ